MKRAALFSCVVFVLGCDEPRQTSTNPHTSISSGDLNKQEGSDIASAEIVRIRLVPFTREDGVRTQMVLVDWKNTGTTTIRAVDADIHVFDQHGNTMESGSMAKPIYAVSDSEPGISPGETYIEPRDKGYILAPFFGKAVRTEVIITQVVETGAFGDMLDDRPAHENAQGQPANTSATGRELEQQQIAAEQAPEEAQFRTWTSAGGKFNAEARIVSYANGVVTLERRDGNRTKVHIDKLSDSDREFISAWRKERR